MTLGGHGRGSTEGSYCMLYWGGEGVYQVGALRPTALYHASVYLVDTCPIRLGKLLDLL